MHFRYRDLFDISFKIICLVFLQYAIFYEDSNFANAIIGRKVKVAGSGDFPFVVSMVTLVDTENVEQAHRCTAALITTQDVLTAEHCVENMAPSGFILMIGSNNLRKAKPYFSAWWVSYNIWARGKPGHRRFRNNDLAIIKLNRNVESGIPYAHFINTTIPSLDGLEVYVVGWGLVEDDCRVKKLRKGKVKILNKDVCENRTRQLGNNQNFVIDERRLCTSADPYILIRQGDSGGPLIYNNGIVGVTYGSGPKLENDAVHQDQVNFHFSTYYYREFIFDVMTESRINYE